MVVLCEGNVLKSFTYNGLSENTATASGKFEFFNDTLYNIQGSVLRPAGIECNDFCFLNDSLFCSHDFLDLSYLTRRKINGEKEVQSLLIDRTTGIEAVNGFLTAKTASDFYVFDADLNLLHKKSGVVFCRAGKKIVAVSQHDNDTEVVIFDKNWQPEASKELPGTFSDCDLTNEFILCSTDKGLYNLTFALEEKWQKEPQEFVRCFVDEEDHALCGSKNNLTIFQVPTGLEGWHKRLDYPICGLNVNSFGFVASTYEGGGVFFFGECL